MTSDRPAITLLPGRHKRLREGHPWVYSNEILLDADAKALAPGSLVRLAAANGQPLGTGFFNPHSLVAARFLAPDPAVAVDEGFFTGRLQRALALREALFDTPFYRLCHAEADGLPGLVIDRYGDVLVAQLNAAGMDRLQAPLLAALDRLLAPRIVLFRNDSPVRALEGLASEVRFAKGSLDGPIELLENGARFLAEPASGQKTGWFFDQRNNRAFMAALARGRSVIDLFCFSGGFAITAARAGASRVLGIDRSDAPLDLARRSAILNNVGEHCQFERGQAFEEMERRASGGERYDIVICDPPAFVKSRKDLGPGAKGYRKMSRLAAQLAMPGGFLFLASCSHNMPAERFAEEIRHGIVQAGRQGRILLSAGAAPDHPVHPFLPESAYLKAQVIQLD